MAMQLTPEEIAARRDGKIKLGISLPSVGVSDQAFTNALPQTSVGIDNVNKASNGINADIASGNLLGVAGRVARGAVGVGQAGVGLARDAASGVADLASSAAGAGGFAVGNAVDRFKEGFNGVGSPTPTKVDGPTQAEMIVRARQIGMDPARLNKPQPVAVQAPASPAVQAVPQADQVQSAIQPPQQVNKQYNALVGNPYVGKPGVSVDTNGVTQINSVQPERNNAPAPSAYPTTPQYKVIDPYSMTDSQLYAAKSFNANLKNFKAESQGDAKIAQDGTNAKLQFQVGMGGVENGRMNAVTGGRNADTNAAELGFKLDAYKADAPGKQALQDSQIAHFNAQSESLKNPTSKVDAQRLAGIDRAYGNYFNKMAEKGEPAMSRSDYDAAIGVQVGKPMVDKTGDLQVGSAKSAVDMPAAQSRDADMAKYRAKIKASGNNPSFIKEFKDRYGVAP